MEQEYDVYIRRVCVRVCFREAVSPSACRAAQIMHESGCLSADL